MKRLGEYELLRKIGSGGMAEVWMGRRTTMSGASKAVAIKLLARDMIDEPAYRQMFIDEARLSMLLTNSNVVQVFDVGEIDGEIYMVMEWIDGLNLAELRRKMLDDGEALDTEVAAHIVGEVLRGLAYAHALHHDGSQATIVHRDVSPQNVLLSVSGEVKLADFGVARLAREETSGLHVKGKLRYMAPEQLRGRSREPTVDLYAVGAILHELLAGEKFRNTRDEGDLYSMVLSGEYTPLPSQIPAELVTLVRRLLEPDPQRRIPTADDALELLHQWPGYRNGSIDLAKLVRRWVGVRAPRSGIVNTREIDEAVAARQAAAKQAVAKQAVAKQAAAKQAVAEQAEVAAGDEPTSVEPSPTNVLAAADETVHEQATATGLAASSGPTEAAPVAETRTWVASAAETDSPTSPSIPAAGSGPVADGRMRLWMALMNAAAVLAIGFGVMGLGFGMGWWGLEKKGGGDEVGEDGDTRGGGSEDASGSTEASAGLANGTGIAETGSGETGSGETGSGETGSTETDSTETDSTETDSTESAETGSLEPKAKIKLVPVRFSVGDMGFVYVKVAGKVLSLEPNADVKIKPGKHRIWIRVDPNEPWKLLSKRLQIDGPALVRMQKPDGLEVVPQ